MAVEENPGILGSALGHHLRRGSALPRSCRVVAVEPNESCIVMCGEVGWHLIEGISDG